MRQYLLIKLARFWPPYFFAGIRIKIMSPDYRYIKGTLKLRFWNANYVGTQFGGSIYSMADPVYMLMLIKNLGKDFIVWDKSATINYLNPGKTALVADFILTEDDLTLIRKVVAENGKMDWLKTIEIKDKEGSVIAEVQKVISIKQRSEIGKI